ncbi:MAG: Cna B-type domain-containing protein [Firmicutes bacterium]|nr:Cna B-type domain-containing protein [Bacillota bacterium]
MKIRKTHKLLRAAASLLVVLGMVLGSLSPALSAFSAAYAEEGVPAAEPAPDPYDPNADPADDPYADIIFPEPYVIPHEGTPHVYRDGVCELCGEHIIWDLYLNDDDPAREDIYIYTRDDSGRRYLIPDEILNQIAVIVIMLKSDQPDYRYDAAMNAGMHGSTNAFAWNDIYVQTMGQFNPDFETLYLTLLVDENNDLIVTNVEGGEVKVRLHSSYDPETGTYDNLSPNGHPQYGLEIDMVRKPSEKAPRKVKTVESGFKINLYDYAVGASAVQDMGGASAPGDIRLKGINAVSDLKFFRGEPGTDEDGTASNELSEDFTARQGIVAPEADEDGYPVLTEFGGSSLEVLFGEDEIPGAKQVFSDVDRLFSDDGKGGLVYDSVRNYAYFDKEQGDGGSFEVYDGTYNQSRLTSYSKIDSGVSVGFFPFDKYNTKKNEIRATADDPLNHGHGLMIEGQIYVPASGRIDGEPLTFSFEGDDDAWLFIDDVLVLDAGGIHGDVSGSVDFSTGEVSISNAEAIAGAEGTTGTDTTLQAIFKAVGKEWTNKKRGGHSFKFYSLERDGSVSDLKIKTNLNKILDRELTDVTVVKKWVDENGEETEAWADSAVVKLYQTVNGEKTPALDDKGEQYSLTLSADSDWKGVFKSLPAVTDDHVEIDYTVEEDPVEGASPSYERGGKEVRTDVYWVRTSAPDEGGVYAILGKEYSTSDGESSVRDMLLTAQGEDKEVTYRSVKTYTPEEPIVDVRDGREYSEYIKPVEDDQIWVISKTDPVTSVMRRRSSNEYETETGPDGTVYRVLVPDFGSLAYSMMYYLPRSWRTQGIPYIPNSNNVFYVEDDGSLTDRYYPGSGNTFYVKDDDGNFVEMVDTGSIPMMLCYVYDGEYIKCVHTQTGEIYYRKDLDTSDTWYVKENGQFREFNDDEYQQINTSYIQPLSECEKNEDGYVVWHPTAQGVSGYPLELYSDETLYEFYTKEDGEYVPMDPEDQQRWVSNSNPLYMPNVVPNKDENGYTMVRNTGTNETYYVDKDGKFYSKDEQGNYTRVYPMGNAAGYTKWSVEEADGPVYQWQISNQGLELTLMGPGQQWTDYTFITSKKDGQGNSNDSTIGNSGFAMGTSYLRQLYSDYNFRNVFRFEDMNSEYGTDPSSTDNGLDYDTYGARIFSFQDIWIFDGLITPYEKNLTVNASNYTTKESYDLAQAGRFWFYKPVPVDNTYDLSQNDWTITNRPAGDLKIEKQIDGMPDGSDDVFEFTVKLEDPEGANEPVAQTVTGTYGDIEFTEGSATVEIKAGESKTAAGIPAGLSYSVEEIPNNEFELISSENAEGTIERGAAAEVLFVNGSHTEISVKKKWNDNNDKDGLRPSSIKVRLLADGEEVAARTVTEKDGWEWTFRDLPRFSGGKKITYTVEEDSVRFYLSSVKGSADKGFTIVNDQIASVPEEGEVQVRAVKQLEGRDLKEGEFEFEMIEVGKNGEPIEGAKAVNASAKASGLVDFGTIRYKDEDDIGTHYYRISEVIPTGDKKNVSYDDSVFYLKVDVKAGKVASGSAVVSDVKIINASGSAISAGTGRGDAPSYPLRIETEYLGKDMGPAGSLFDENGESLPLFRNIYKAVVSAALKVQKILKQLGEAIALRASDLFSFGVKAVTENAPMPETTTRTATGSGLVIFDGIEFTQDDIGKTYRYEIAEQVPDDAKNADGVTWAEATDAQKKAGGFRKDDVIYSSKPVSAEIEISYDDKSGELKAAVTYSGKEAVPEIENELAPPQTIDIPVRKVWDDQGDKDKIRPESVTVRLLADGEDSGLSLELNEDNSWKGTFEALETEKDGKAVEYTVEEDVPEGYEASVKGSPAKGFAVTNTHEPEKPEVPVRPTPTGVGVSVRKVWDDQGNKDGIRPDSVTVRLLVNGEDSGKSAKLSAANGWRARFDGLDGYVGGKKAVYTVEEADVPAGYEASVSGSSGSGFVVTNTHEPGVVPPPEVPGEPPETPEEPPETPEEPPLNPEVPKTGEDVNASLLWGIAALLSAMAAAYAASRRRRSR